MSDLYSILEVDRTASADDIKSAYKRLARIHHPDKGGDEARFKELGKAYEVLSDEQRRAQYDQTGRTEPEAQGPVPHDIFQQMFQNFAQFSFFGGQSGPDPNARGPSTVHVLPITLQDSFFGFTKTATVVQEKFCASCYATCKRCNGTGLITTQTRGIPPFIHISNSVCPVCGGKQMEHTSNAACDVCKGAGKYEESHTVGITVPPGMASGERIKYAGLANQQSPSVKPGSLYIEIALQKNTDFYREGDNLVHNVELTLKESLVGKVITIPYFTGNIELDTSTIGIIRSGMRHRMAERGFRTPGVLVVEFIVKYPETLSEDVRKQLMEIDF
jgi:DnaJ-class molecular chaperone